MSDPAIAVPPVPLTVRAGRTAYDVTLRAVRRRAWVLLVPVGLLVLAGALSDDPVGTWLAGGVPVAVLCSIPVVVLGAMRLYGRSTITVTEDELVVRRVRRRTLRRADLGEALLGFFTTDGPGPAPGALQLCVTRSDGKGFVRLPVDYWPDVALAQVLVVLGLESRQQDPRRDRRARPFRARHPLLMALGVLVMLVVALAGALVALG